LAQSLSKVIIHFIYSTKSRKPYLSDSSIRNEMFRYLSSIVKNHDSPPLVVGGVADHVHILCSFSRNHTIADVVRELKRSSSKWIKTKGIDFSDFHWQSGYGAFSVSQSNVDKAIRYIEKQEEHHKKESFQEEYRRFLKKYQVDYDEQYVWD